MKLTWARLAKGVFTAALALAVLYVVWLMAAAGQLLLAGTCLVAAAIVFYTYLAGAAYTWRYLLPGIAGILVFVVLPIAYTVRIGFTNYSSRNLLSFERATRYLLEETVAGKGQRFDFALLADGDGYRLLFTQKEEEPAGSGDAPAPDAPVAPPAAFVTPRLALALAGAAAQVQAVPLAQAGFTPGEPLALRDVIRNRPALALLEVRFPDGTRATMTSLREFAPVEPRYRPQPDGTLIDGRTSAILTPNSKTGFYELASGEQIRPGFRVDVGFANYVRTLTDPALRMPLFRVFLWTVTFAGLTVLFTLVVGTTLAVLLNWEALRFRTFYRTLLFLPYAVPGFISILVFRGLFNQSFGELNLILGKLFGIHPAWFADPFLAKCMILIVNTWLGYPYIMVLCTGLIKAIPGEVYEASALAGAGPLDNFFRITAPLIIRPLMPLLISSFAFNFNNFVLISLLTNGRPDFLDARIPAGTTDILVSYTYRIAFQDSGQNFGLAAAISTVIFGIVAVLSLVNLRLTRANADQPE